jgi:hypothetical protein
MYEDDVWYHGLKPLVDIPSRLLFMSMKNSRRWPERYRDLIQDVHSEYFTLPMADDGYVWHDMMTCAASISAQDFLNQVHAFIQKGHSMGETGRYVKYVFDWMSTEAQWFNIPGISPDYRNRAAIAALLLPIAIQYGISFQSHPQFCLSLARHILTRASYEVVRQWMITYGMPCPFSLLYYILQKSTEERAQFLPLVKGYIRQDTFLIHDDLDALSEIVHKVPCIVLEILRLNATVDFKAYNDLVCLAQQYISMYQSSTEEHMIPPIVSIVMEYIG